jgi:hypothetical protein
MTSSGSRECDMDFVGLDHVRPGPWITAIRESRAQRQQCAQPPMQRKYERFKVLVDQWRHDTWYKSSISRRISHIAYLKIIGLGGEAVPWILKELRDEPDYWFAALEAITEVDPAPGAKNLSELRDAWLEWGKDRIAR